MTPRSDHNMQKQMGCMSGFLHIFDRHQLLYTKRLPAPEGDEVLLEMDKLNMSPADSKNNLIKSPQPSVDQCLVDSSFKVETPTKSPKFSPRLSLDSTATFDVTGGSLYRKQMQINSSNLSAYHRDCRTDTSSSRRSTSVIAKLMGIESLPDSTPGSVAKQAEPRKSASESRSVCRDIFQSRTVEINNDNGNVKIKKKNHIIKSNVIREIDVDQSRRGGLSRGLKPPQQRKSFFNSADIFPEPTQNVSLYGEIERRLKMRGIDEPSKDLQTLKQILEAMQLKGLLHSSPWPQIKNKNIVYDRNHSHFSEAQSPIVLIKPLNRRVTDESPPSNIRSNSANRVSLVSPRRQRQGIDLNVSSPVRARISGSPTRTETGVRMSNSRSNSTVKPKKPLTIETQRRGNESAESRKVSSKISPRRNVTDQAVTNRSLINKRPIEDEFSSSVSESSVSTPSQTDTERFKAIEHKEGRRLVDRCDKLLNSIAEMNATESQPSPVSVLDSSYYKDDSSLSPSPVIKRNVSFPVELDELGSPGISSVLSGDEINDSDFVYISMVVKAWNFTPEEANDHIFLQLEKQHYIKSKDSSTVSKLQRRVIFDTITEIVKQNINFPPWKAMTIKNWNTSRPLVQQIWSEFQRIGEQQSSDDLFEVICGILKKDLAGDAITGWEDCPIEMSEAVLDIERLIFKDLVEESIRDMAESAAKSSHLAPRRKLVF